MLFDVVAARRVSAGEAERRILDSITCSDLGGFHVTSRAPGFPDFNDTLSTWNYSLTQPIEARSVNGGGSVRIDKDGAHITNGLIFFRTGEDAHVLCPGEGSLVRAEYSSDDYFEQLRTKARFVNLSEGADCDRPLDGEVDVCFSGMR